MRCAIRGSSSSRQRGVAIVSALLIVVLATTVVTGLFDRVNVTIRSVENRTALAQTKWLERTAVAWARVVLALDGRVAGGVDHYGELWAQLVEDTVLDETVTGGARLGDERNRPRLQGRVLDAQARFNLNNLIEDADGRHRKAFERLLESLGQPRSLAVTLQQRLARTVARTANGRTEPASALPMFRVTDLLVLPGFDEAVLDAIDPYVAFLPGVTKVNLNTAEAPVIAAMVDGLDIESARRFTMTQTRAYASVAAAMAALRPGAGANEDLLSVSSNFFLVRGVVRYDRVESRSDALLRRQSGKVEVVWQQRS